MDQTSSVIRDVYNLIGTKISMRTYLFTCNSATCTTIKDYNLVQSDSHLSLTTWSLFETWDEENDKIKSGDEVV